MTRLKVTPEEYRRIALGFPGATQGSHMDHPDFRVGGRIFATLWKEEGVVLLSPDQQAQLVRSNPDAFSPVKGGWGRRGSTTVHLEDADKPSVRRALSMAYQRRVSRNRPKKGTPGGLPKTRKMHPQRKATSALHGGRRD